MSQCSRTRRNWCCQKVGWRFIPTSACHCRHLNEISPISARCATMDNYRFLHTSQPTGNNFELIGGAKRLTRHDHQCLPNSQPECVLAGQHEWSWMDSTNFGEFESKLDQKVRQSFCIHSISFHGILVSDDLWWRCTLEWWSPRIVNKTGMNVNRAMTRIAVTTQIMNNENPVRFCPHVTDKLNFDRLVETIIYFGIK